MKSNMLKYIQTVMNDCEVQYDSLDDNNDVSWDCYHKENWINMYDLLNEVKEYLESQVFVLTLEDFTTMNDDITLTDAQVEQIKNKFTIESWSDDVLSFMEYISQEVE